MDRKTLSKNFIAYLANSLGEDASEITEKTKISSLGLDGYDLADIGNSINKLTWMHGFRIDPIKIVGCTTVGKVVDVIAEACGITNNS